jgi:DNA-binding PadR family transcriptional regulator
MSSYEINKALTKEFHVMIGPSTIYSKLYTLEKQGQIQRVEGRVGKVYELTEQGQQTISNMPLIIEEICDSAQILLTNQTIAYRKNKKAESLILWERRSLLKLQQQESEFSTSHA